MKKILDPILEITRQRDLDSLENSLVTTLAEMLPVITVCLCKLVKDKRKSLFKETAKVTNDSPDAKGKGKGIHDKPCLLEENVANCLKMEKPTSFILDEGVHRLLIPIRCEHEVVGLVKIDSFEDITSHGELIEGVIKVYENYRAVFVASERDQLTGLLNRRTFDNKLDRFLTEQKNKQLQYGTTGEHRTVQPKSHAWLAMIDIDHFKRINDSFGHLYGDEVLLQLAQIMEKSFRDSDVLFRFGGEEFVVILEPITYEQASLVLNRFREKIAAVEFSQVGTVTLSIGFEKIGANDFPPEVLDHADVALYYAKEHGRNCVHNYTKLIVDGELDVHLPPSKLEIF